MEYINFEEGLLDRNLYHTFEMRPPSPAANDLAGGIEPERRDHAPPRGSFLRRIGRIRIPGRSNA